MSPITIAATKTASEKNANVGNIRVTGFELWIEEVGCFSAFDSTSYGAVVLGAQFALWPIGLEDEPACWEMCHCDAL